MRAIAFSIVALGTACTLTTALDGLSGGTTIADDAGGRLDAEASVDAPTADVSKADAQERCTTVGPRFPTGETAPTWKSPKNIEAQDDLGAEVQVYSGKNGTIDAKAFGFAIPPAARIAGVEVAVRRQSNDMSTFQDASVKVDVGGAHERANAAYWPQGTWETKAFGGPTDLWGTDITPAVVNSDAFGVTYVAQYAITAGNAYGSVDSISISVTYCE